MQPCFARPRPASANGEALLDMRLPPCCKREFAFCPGSRASSSPLLEPRLDLSRWEGSHGKLEPVKYPAFSCLFSHRDLRPAARAALRRTVQSRGGRCRGIGGFRTNPIFRVELAA